MRRPIQHLRSRALTAVLLSLSLSAWAGHDASGQPAFKSGGIGEGGVHAMRQAAHDFSAGLTFANKAGEYLADVDVCIKDARDHEVLSTVTDGPILLVDLPPGHYTVEAEFEGRTVERALSVPARGRREITLHI